MHDSRFHLNRNTFEFIVESLPMGVTLCSDRGMILYCNQKEADLHGYAVAELIGQSASILAPSELRQELSPDQYRSLSQWRRESRNRRKDGSEFPVQLYSHPIRDARGEFLGLLTVCEDLTELTAAKQALQDSEANFRYIIENISDALWIYNVTKKEYTYRSPTVFGLRGYTYEEACHHTNEQVFTPESKIYIEEQLVVAITDFMALGDQTKVYRHEIQMNHKTKGPIWVEVSAQFRYNQVGNLEFYGLSRYIDDRKKAEIALQNSLQDLKLAQQIANIGNWSLDPAQDRPVWSEMVFKIYERNPALGPPQLDEYRDIYGSKQFEILKNAVQTAHREGKPFNLEIEIVLPSDQRKWVNTICRPDPDPGPNGYFLRGTIQDVTERRLTMDKLTHQTHMLREMSLRLSEKEDEERRKIARDLHDDVGQNLTALSFSLKLIQTQLPPDNMPQAHQYVTDALHLINDVGDSIRNLLMRLYSPVLDDFGLITAIRLYAEKFSQRHNIHLDLNLTDWQPRPNHAVEKTLLRIVQEALTNITKHAAATRISIDLKIENEMIRLTIRDNGKGFDAAGLSVSNSRDSWGLLTMKERIEGINGTFHVDSKQNRGTTIIVEVPHEH